MFFFYSVLFTLGVLITAPYYLWRLRGHILSSADWRERLGFLPPELQQSERGAIWVHAVSVGETLAAAGLVRELQRRFPDRRIFMSHVTVAGREAGVLRLPDIAGRFLLPLDLAWCMRRAFRRVRPGLLVIVETELWPNLLRVARESETPVVVINGRISDRSFPRYRRIGGVMRQVLANVNVIAAQSQLDANRFLQMGAVADRVVVTGNLKFDAKPPELGEFAQMLSKILSASGRKPVLVAGSTMPGEEERVLTAWKHSRQHHPRSLLILAPRHPARFESVGALLARQGVRFVRRTQMAASDNSLANQIEGAEVLLLDTIGELAGVFELADVVFMGGSLLPTGGHNVLEPAYWAKPIIFGPHMHNFRDIAQLMLTQGAAVQVRDVSSLSAELADLFGNPERRQQLGLAARQVLDGQRGATGRVLALLEPYISSTPSNSTLPATRRP